MAFLAFKPLDATSRRRKMGGIMIHLSLQVRDSPAHMPARRRQTAFLAAQSLERSQRRKAE
jgi:hypothetical protein